MPNLVKGDVVRFKSECALAGTYNEAVVERVEGGKAYFVGNDYHCHYSDYDTEYHTFLRSGEIKKGNIMSDIIQKIRELNLEPDTKLLREAGLIDGDNHPTEEGRKLASELYFETRKDDIVALVKKATADEEKSKAKK